MPKYKTIVADPPWDYGRCKNAFRMKSKKGGKLDSGISASMRYDTMTLDQIKSMRVADIAADNAHLYLWTTNTYLEAAFEVARLWGFSYRTTITWGKVQKKNRSVPSMKVGYYYRGATEHCLFCVRGSLPLQCKSPASSTLFIHERERHSSKPVAFMDIVKTYSPSPRIELFARRCSPGFDSWGNEVDGVGLDSLVGV